MNTEAMVTRNGVLDIQVCVPTEWTDKEVTQFANRGKICGTAAGWVIRKEGDEALRGDPERVPCEERSGFVHIMLDA